MAGEVKVFGLGLGGVNLVKSPLEMDDNELVQAQNAEPFKERGVAGIRKRAGLQRVVPTGTVAPSALSGSLAGFVPIANTFGVTTDPQSIPIYIGLTLTGGIYSVNSGTTFAAFTSPSGSTTPTGSNPLLGLEPNAKYNLEVSAYEYISDYPVIHVLSGYTENIGTASSRVVYTKDLMVFGGHESGQVLAFTDKGVIELTRVPASGSVDDCLPIGVWRNAKPTTSNYTFDDTFVVIAIVGGAMVLYSPSTRQTIQLPSLAATATGCAVDSLGYLYAAAGKTIYSIKPGVDTAWTTAYALVDANVGQFTSMANLGGSTFFVGTKRTAASGSLYIAKFSVGAAGVLTRVQSGGADSLEVSQSISPTYVHPMTAGGTIWALYVGGTGSTLAGAEGDGSSPNTRHILRYTGTQWTNSFDVQTALSSPSNRTMGVISNGAYGRNAYFMARYTDGASHNYNYVIWAAAYGTTWVELTAATPLLAVLASTIKYPLLIP